LRKDVDLGIWPRLSQLTIALLIAAMLIAVGFWYLPLYQQNERMRRRMLELEAKIAQETDRHTQLEARIRSLREDPKTVERVAREKLGYAKPGETVIYFEPPAR
jgi:cell division protein FtsB